MRRHNTLLFLTLVSVSLSISCASGSTQSLSDVIETTEEPFSTGALMTVGVSDDVQEAEEINSPGAAVDDFLIPAGTTEPLAVLPPESVSAEVLSVVDGDTIKVLLDGEPWSVRYIGIDTPETVHPDREIEWMGEEACAANRALVEGQVVYLEKDVSETDRYGRLLRYVYLEDGTFVNAELVRQGYAMVVSYPPDVRWQDLFLKIQTEAREAAIGLWSSYAEEGAAGSSNGGGIYRSGTCMCHTNVYNCSDFDSQFEAQKCFDACAASGAGDVHHLDGDNNGIACERLP